MTKQNRQSISVIAILLAAFLVALGWGISHVNAAPQESYFTTATQADTSHFSSWVSANDTAQVCSAYEIVFDSDSCIQANSVISDGSNLAAVSGALDNRDNDTANNTGSFQAAVDLTGKRCVNEDGVVEFEINDISLYKLENVSTGRIISESATTANFLTFSDLPDGNYRFTGRSQSGDSAEASFMIDCNKKDQDDEPKLLVQCKVNPVEPAVGEVVTWEAEAEGGSGVYSYQWNGDVTSGQQFISTSYNSPGERIAYLTINSGEQQRTARCSVNVQTEGEVQGAATVTPRTLEEF